MNDEKHGDEPSEKYLKPCTYERSEHGLEARNQRLETRSRPRGVS